MLVVVLGLPGAGKSVLADALAQELGAVIVRSDEVRKRHFPEPRYSEEEKDAVYALMLSEAREALLLKKPVVLDATFYKERHRRNAFLAAEKMRVPIHFWVVFADEKTVLKHLRHRLSAKEKGERVVSNAFVKEYYKVKSEFEPVRERRIVVDASLPLKKQVEIVLKGIK